MPAGSPIVIASGGAGEVKAASPIFLSCRRPRANAPRAPIRTARRIEVAVLRLGATFEVMQGRVGAGAAAHKRLLRLFGPHADPGPPSRPPSLAARRPASNEGGFAAARVRVAAFPT